MSVRIRLARIGKKKAPFFRIVAVDKRTKRDGQYLENLGTYNPLTGELIQYHAEKLEAWLSKGAVPSDTVVRIQRQYARSGVIKSKAPARHNASEGGAKPVPTPVQPAVAPEAAQKSE